MSFFNLTYMGFERPLREAKTQYDSSSSRDNQQQPKPSLSNHFNPYMTHFAKPFDSNLTYHELRHKHVRDPKSKIKKIKLHYLFIFD